MLKLKTAATTEPVSLDAAKAHLRVIHSEDDALIGSLIASAREYLEHTLGRALADAVYIYIGPMLSMPISPCTIQAIAGLADDEVTWDTLTTDDYGYNVDTNQLIGSDYSAHKIEFKAVPGEVPPAVCDAILLRVQADYELGADSAEKLRDAADRLAFPHRIFSGG